MRSALKKFLSKGVIRIPREKERAIYFYAIVIFFAFYLLTRLQEII